MREVVTGYRSGNADAALPSEPHVEFDPGVTTQTERVAAKARELGRSPRWVAELINRYRTQGIYGLVDQRKVRLGGDRVDERVKAALRAELDELTYESNVSKKRISRRTRLRLEREHPGIEIPFPPQTTFNRLVDSLDRGRGTFGSAKARRSAANRPARPYSHLVAHRPGELLLFDSTGVDTFALDPVTFRWIQLQLTIALDLYTRSIVAWRFTPVSTKGVDAALLLYDVVRPKLVQPGWPVEAGWPYMGVPEAVVLEALGDNVVEGELAGIPFVHPESVLVDHGKIFLSQAFTDGCTRLGTNLFLARPLTPTDKSFVERVFRTIRESFVENLPGYRGPDLFSRGCNVENAAFFFVDEVDARFAEWVAVWWQRRHHEGLQLPSLPNLHLSPNDMYEEGLARAGFVYLVPDPALYYELLPTVWRTVQHYGVEIDGLKYDGEILEDFRNQRSPFEGVHAGKWPIRYDPRDRSRVFFYDTEVQEWHTLDWIGSGRAPHPFDEGTLSYAKALVIARGGNPRNHDDLEEALHGLLAKIETEVLTGRKERRIAAVRAIRTSQADKDRPIKAGSVQPYEVALRGSADDDDLDEQAERGDEEYLPLFQAIGAEEDEDDDLGF